MRAHKSAARSADNLPSVRDRILGEVSGCQDDALVFAASSIINEITSPQYSGEVVVRTLRTDRGVYTLRGSAFRRPNDPGPVMLVYAENTAAIPAQPTPLVETRIHSRFRLTLKEERVAHMLAARKTNEEIAAELCVSPHTARHHTERVLIKLGIRSRKDVVAVLQED
jgi:DNA-binding CsgD family transcriptional regulator